MIERSIYAIYCDDIRNEIAGKTSMMGIYGPHVIVPAFPIAMAKFCAHITLRLPYKSPASSITIRLLADEEVLGEVVLNESMLQNTPIPPLDADLIPEDSMLSMNFVFAFVPLNISKQTRLRLHANVDGDEIKGNSLLIRLPTDEERKQLGFPDEAVEPKI